MNNKFIFGAIAVVFIVAVIALFTPSSQIITRMVGSTATTNYPSLGTASLEVGSGCGDNFTSCDGTAISRVNTGTCYFMPDATTIAASTTARVTCQGGTKVAGGGLTALTGVTSGDRVVLTLSTTTAAAGKTIGSGFGGLILLGATASSTSGYIETVIYNETGTTYTWPTTGAASGTASYIITK